jgi:hypothetical protein
MNGKVSIYALVDPRNLRVNYVGQSSHIVKRFAAHKAGRDQATASWVSDLHTVAIEPGLVVLDEVEDSAALEAETSWIQEFSRRGPLLNYNQTVCTSPLIRYTLRARVETGETLRAVASKRGIEFDDLVRMAFEFGADAIISSRLVLNTDAALAAKETAKMFGAKGGKASSANMTSEQRQERARKAVQARWAKRKVKP